MKLNFTRLLPVLLAVVLFESSCKKTEIKTVVKSPVDYKALSLQLGLQVYQAISSQMGLGNNTKTTSGSTAITYDIGQCGFTTEPVSHFNSTSGDTVKTEVIHFKFVSTCSAGIVDGYIARAIDTTVTGNVHYHQVKTIDQNYVVQRTDDTYKHFTMNGSLNSTTDYARFDGPFFFLEVSINSNTINTVQQYGLFHLAIDTSGGVLDITSGRATFNDSNYEVDVNHPAPDGYKYNDDGTIDFLGDRTIRVQFSNGQVFVIQLKDYTGAL